MLLRFLREQQGSDKGRDFQAAGAQCMAQPLSGDEENALRYAAGFVPFKLLNKYTKRKEDYKGIIECLRNLSVEDCERATEGGSDESSEIEDYTSQWIAKVDRGGLFKINDNAYHFFRSVENVVRCRLPSRLARKENCDVVAAVEVDPMVVFRWRLLTATLLDDAHSSHLLHEIASLWVTMRGFSMTSAWLEKYKVAKDCLLKKKKALRKSLLKPNQTE